MSSVEFPTTSWKGPSRRSQHHRFTDAESQGLKDILWERAGSIVESPILTQFELNDNRISTSLSEQTSIMSGVTSLCALCLQPQREHEQALRTLSCSHRYHTSCYEKWSTGFRCPLCKSFWDDNSNLLDSAAVHLPFESFVQEKDRSVVVKSSFKLSKNVPASAFLRLGETLMGEEHEHAVSNVQHSSKDAQAKGLALLFMLAQATEEEVECSSSDAS